MDVIAEAYSPERRPLPARDQISLCELMTWLATGEARDQAYLRGLMAQNRGRREPEALWQSIEESAPIVLSAIRSEALPIYASLNDGPRARVPLEYFANDLYLDFVLDRIGPDLLSTSRDEIDLSNVPIYRSARCYTADALRVFGEQQSSMLSHGGIESSPPEQSQPVGPDSASLVPLTPTVGSIAAVIVTPAPSDDLATTPAVEHEPEPVDAAITEQQPTVTMPYKGDIEKAYLIHVQSHRDKNDGRFPTESDDLTWQKSVEITVGRMRELRATHNPNRVGGRPKKPRQETSKK